MRPVALSDHRHVAQLTSVYRISPRIPPTPFRRARSAATGDRRGRGPPLRGGRGHFAHLHTSGSAIADGQLPTRRSSRPEFDIRKRDRRKNLRRGAAGASGAPDGGRMAAVEGAEVLAVEGGELALELR